MVPDSALKLDSLDRRHFVRIAALLGAATTLPIARAREAGRAARHLAGTVVSSAGLPPPANQRVPFGWRSATIAGSELPPLVLGWPGAEATVRPTHLRVVNALDERDDKLVEVSLARSGRVLGTIEVRFASLVQLHALALNAADAAAVLQEGVALRLRHGSPLEIFVGGDTLPPALTAHLLIPGTASATEEFFARLNSLACVQAFGWMEGCVLDGLLDLAELPAHAALRRAAQAHLDLFIRDGRLVCENHLSVPSDGKLYGIEGTLPFAALARLHPQHPLLNDALAFWDSRRRPTGSVQDGGHLSSEGAYTIAYPMARIAQARGDEALMREALYQCRFRQARLFDGIEFWRTYNDDGKRGNRNWARGIAWQLLGLGRTLAVARERRDIGDLVIGFQRLAAWSMKLQRADGLWGVFADTPEVGPDTGGSAGIAAAFALGVKYQWLDAAARNAAQRTLEALGKHLTPDGFLGGVTQGNKSTEELQRGAYRVTYPMAMGLKAQLMAALDSAP